MNHKAYTKEEFEQARNLIQEGIKRKIADSNTLSKWVFVIIASETFLALACIIIGSAMFPQNVSPIPDGCAVVNDVQNCHFETRMTYFPFPEMVYLSSYQERVCEKKLACYDGTVREWSGR